MTDGFNEIKKSKTRQIGLRISETLCKKYELQAKKLDVNYTELMRLVLSRYYEIEFGDKK